MSWVGAIAYAFQIFFDFSGYSDMAIGLGRLFGFHFPPNFNYPYFSASISEFWRRWHISLGTWFRDYVYIPLGGSHVSTKFRLIFNLFIVWLLTGIWHGANWTFIIWGLIFFVFITGEKLTGYPKKFSHPLSINLYRLFTLLVLIISWVIFRSPNLSIATFYLQTMFGLNPHLPAHQLFPLPSTTVTAINPPAIFYLREYAALFIISLIFSLPVFPFLKKTIHRSFSLQLFGRIIGDFCLLIIFIFTVSYLVRNDYNPFIYFNF
jgi:alginate O-acetyltransferase complex protein AlgI